MRTERHKPKILPTALNKWVFPHYSRFIWMVLYDFNDFLALNHQKAHTQLICCCFWRRCVLHVFHEFDLFPDFSCSRNTQNSRTRMQRRSAAAGGRSRPQHLYIHHAHTSAPCRCVFFTSHVAAVVAAGLVRKYKVAAADSIADLLVMGQTVTQSNFLRVHGISPMTSRPGLRALPQGLFCGQWMESNGRLGFPRALRPTEQWMRLMRRKSFLVGCFFMLSKLKCCSSDSSHLLWLICGFFCHFLTLIRKAEGQQAQAWHDPHSKI